MILFSEMYAIINQTQSKEGNVMFRDMRRSRQLLPMEEAEQILKTATSGVLALEGEYPYAVPMSHLYRDSALYFHSGMQGQKAEAVMREGKASYCVIAQDDVVAQTFSTRYKSVIAFGRICVIENAEEKLAAIRALASRFSPGFEEAAEKEIEESLDHLLMFKLEIEHMTGKEALALTQERG